MGLDWMPTAVLPVLIMVGSVVLAVEGTEKAGTNKAVPLVAAASGSVIAC